MLTRCWSAAARAARRGSPARAAAAARLAPPPVRAAAGCALALSRPPPCTAAPRRRGAAPGARSFGSAPAPPAASPDQARPPAPARATPALTARCRRGQVRVTVLVNGVAQGGEGSGSAGPESEEAEAEGGAPLFEADFDLVEGADGELELDSDVEDGGARPTRGRAKAAAR